MKKQKTTYKEATTTRDWVIIDAKDQILGRLSTKIANELNGKTKVSYNPSVDDGNCVVVINANQIKLTGKKELKKVYYSHSGYPGGLKETPYLRMLDKKPEKIIENSVKGMLPKNKLGSRMYSRLKVYPDSNHPHSAQVTTTNNVKDSKETN